MLVRVKIPAGLSLTIFKLTERWTNMMKFIKALHAKILLSLLACLLASAPGAVQAQTEAQNPAGEPTVVFESRDHDFGTVQPDAPLAHDFIFKNQGTAALLIKNVKAG
jgi:hypothetical protein